MADTGQRFISDVVTNTLDDMAYSTNVDKEKPPYIKP